MKGVSKLELDKWNSLCHLDPACTFFHTPQWYNVACNYLACNAELIFSTEDVIFPCIKYRRGFRRRMIFQSSPFGTYGGLIGTRENCEEHLLNAIQHKRLFVRTNPYVKKATFNKLTIEKPGFTQIINLTKQASDILANWSANHKRNFKKAIQDDLTFRFDHSPERGNRYFSIYKKSISRWGKSKKTHYHKKLFKLISGINNEHVIFCYVSKDDMDISAAIFFFWHQRIHYWNGVNTIQGLEHHASLFLFYQVLNWGVANGYTVLDFNPSNNLEGVINFKSKFGSVKLPSHLLSNGF